MPKYTIKQPDGSVYDVDSDSADQATADLQAHLQEEANAKAQAEFNDAPGWKKPLMAADDVARTMADTVTFGMLDKVIGGNAAMETQARRSRMGGADIAGDIAATAAALPTAVPKVMAKVGGGKVIRGITGLLGGAGEGAAYGAGQAAGHDQPVAEGAATGGISGMLGQTVASALGSGANKVAKWWTGASDALPTPVAAGRVTKKTSPEKQIETATARAEREGGNPGAYREKFREVRDKGMTNFSPEERDAVMEVIKGDPGTRAAYGLGGVLNPSTGLIGAIGSTLMEKGASPTSALVAGAVPLAGYAARSAAGQGVKQSVEDARRIASGRPEYQGILSKKGKGKLATGLRGGLLDYLQEE